MLSDAARELTGVGAVVGRAFTIDLVDQLVDGRGEDDTRRRRRRAVAARHPGGAGHRRLRLQPRPDPRGRVPDLGPARRRSVHGHLAERCGPSRRRGERGGRRDRRALRPRRFGRRGSDVPPTSRRRRGPRVRLRRRARVQRPWPRARRRAAARSRPRRPGARVPGTAGCRVVRPWQAAVPSTGGSTTGSWSCGRSGASHPSRWRSGRRRTSPSACGTSSIARRGEQLLALGAERDDPLLLTEGHYMVGVSSFWLAEFERSHPSTSTPRRWRTTTTSRTRRAPRAVRTGSQGGLPDPAGVHAVGARPHRRGRRGSAGRHSTGPTPSSTGTREGYVRTLRRVERLSKQGWTRRRCGSRTGSAPMAGTRGSRPWRCPSSPDGPLCGEVTPRAGIQLLEEAVSTSPARSGTSCSSRSRSCSSLGPMTRRGDPAAGLRVATAAPDIAEQEMQFHEAESHPHLGQVCSTAPTAIPSETEELAPPPRRDCPPARCTCAGGQGSGPLVPGRPWLILAGPRSSSATGTSCGRGSRLSAAPRTPGARQ